MSKVEEYIDIVKNRESTRWSRFYYKHVLKKCKRAAKKGYTGRWFYDTWFNPYIENKLKDEGFEIKKGEGKEIGEILVDWENA